jgi:hypothetical protein
MTDLLLTPGAPFFALSAAGALLAALGLLRAEQARRLFNGFRVLPDSAGFGARLALGQAAALPAAGLVLLAGIAAGASGRAWTLMLAVALGLYLYLGLVLPRRPFARAEAERRALRRLTPGFVSYVRVALSGYESPAALLERYAGRPRKRILPLQILVAEALDLMRERRLRPFEALRTVARVRGCRELSDVAETLAQAEADGISPQTALAAHQATLEAILRDEFSRMLKRRTMWLLLAVALSLVIGILANLLFVMVAGSALFNGGL